MVPVVSLLWPGEGDLGQDLDDGRRRTREIATNRQEKIEVFKAPASSGAFCFWSPQAERSSSREMTGAMSAFGPKRTCATEQLASADRSEADIQCEHHPRQLMTQSGHGVSRFVVIFLDQHRHAYDAQRL